MLPHGHDARDGALREEEIRWLFEIAVLGFQVSRMFSNQSSIVERCNSIGLFAMQPSGASQSGII